jgi:hypothetical protein
VGGDRPVADPSLGDPHRAAQDLRGDAQQRPVAPASEPVELGGDLHRHVPLLDHPHRVRGHSLEDPTLAARHPGARLHRVAGLGEDLGEQAARGLLGRPVLPPARGAARVDERERSHPAHASGLAEDGPRAVEHVEHVDHERGIERPGREREPVAARADESAKALLARPPEHAQREVGARHLEAAVGQGPRDPPGPDTDLEDRADAGPTQLPRDAVDRRGFERVAGRVVDRGDLVERLADLLVRHRASGFTVDGARPRPGRPPGPARSRGPASTTPAAARRGRSGRRRTVRRGRPRSVR